MSLLCETVDKLCYVLVMDVYILCRRYIKHDFAILQELSRKKWLEICMRNGSRTALCIEARENEMEHQKRTAQNLGSGGHLVVPRNVEGFTESWGPLCTWLQELRYRANVKSLRWVSTMSTTCERE